jgi:alpha-glucosidase
MLEFTDKMLSPDTWWRNGVIYQIYPRSFQDTDGDGIGDLAGIRQRLGYLAALGVDAVWISPFFPSPMADFGYDVADYCDVDPRFGTLADFDALMAEAKALVLRVILDFVPNHTSDLHPWFVQSRSGKSDRSATGICGATRPDGGRRTIGSAISAARRERSMPLWPVLRSRS